MHIADIAKLGFLPLRSQEKNIDLGSRVALYGFRAKGGGLEADVASMDDSDEPSVGEVMNSSVWRAAKINGRPMNGWAIGGWSVQVETPSMKAPQ